MGYRLLAAAALLAPVFAAGCGTMKAYPGPERAKSETAVVSGQFVLQNIGLTKIMVAPPNDDGGEPLSGFSSLIEVLSGNQHLFASFCAPSGGALSCRDRKLLQFYADAGHSYAVEGSGYDHVWIVDSGTGEVVADFRSAERVPRPKSAAALAGLPEQGDAAGGPKARR